MHQGIAFTPYSRNGEENVTRFSAIFPLPIPAEKFQSEDIS
jgi:hypothetical protein